MLDAPVFICASNELAEGNLGVRFPITEAGRSMTGFAVRFDGVVQAFVNRCAHVPMELDWTPGQFFDGTGLYLMCATHGAVYEPDTGRCAGGPCKGGRLRSITVIERDGQVFWQPDDILQPAA